MQEKYEKAKNALWGWIYVYYHVQVPRVAVCTDKGHCSPFDALSFAFLNQDEDCLWIGSRGSGKTTSFAMLNSLDCLIFDGCDTFTAGGLSTQAEKCYKYFLDFVRLPCWSAYFNSKETRKSSIDLDNGSHAAIAAATIEQFNGPHPHKFFADEIELISRDVMNEGVYMVKGSKRIPGQSIFTTSRKFPWGPAEAMMKEIEKGQSPVNLFIWCAFDSVETCTEVSCEPCKNKFDTGGRAFYDLCVFREGTGEYSNGKHIMRAKMADGHFPLKTLWKIHQSINNSPKKFDSQVLSLSPSRDALVYPMIREEIHMKPHDSIMEKLKNVPSPMTVNMVIDWGFVDPTAIAFYVEHGDQIFILDEIYEAGLIPTEVMTAVRDKIKFNGWNMGTMIVDPSKKDSIEMFSRAGFSVFEADNRQEIGIAETQSSLRWVPAVGEVPMIEPMVIFSDRCKNIFRDCAEYHWSTRDPNELSENVRKKPEIHQSDHGADVLRYLIMKNFHSGSTETINPIRSLGPKRDGEWSYDEPGWNF